MSRSMPDGIRGGHTANGSSAVFAGAACRAGAAHAASVASSGSITTATRDHRANDLIPSPREAGEGGVEGKGDR